MDIEKIISNIDIDKNYIEPLKEAAAKSSNSFWWLKLIALAEALITCIEKEDNLDGINKKKIAEEILYPIYDKLEPKKLAIINTITLGAIKKFICNTIIEGIVWCYNNTFGKKWKDKTDSSK